jgi:hypothetical protein
MDPGPLVSEQIDAYARFLDEFQKYAPVRAAFWLKEGDGGHRYLYLASDQISDENFDRAYEEVARIAGRLQDPWFDPFRVKVLGTHRPLAKAVLDVIRQYGDKRPIRLCGTTLGGRDVDELYVCPAPAAAGMP